MNICDQDHEEIVYEGKGCPACLLIQEIEGLKSEIEDLREEMNDHECKP